MSLIFRTSGPWGAGKGSNLTPAEVDENFWQLLQDVLSDTDEVPPVGIANIIVTGSQMTIVLDNAVELGPFALPFATFTWVGEWAPDTSYGELDVFSVEGTGVFLVIQAHTSASSFDPTEENTDGPLLRQLFGSSGSGGAGRAYTSVRPFAGTDVDFSSELTLLRAGALWRLNPGLSCTVWLPDDADLNYPVGTILAFELIAASATMTFTASNLHYRATQSANATEQYALVEAVKVDVDTWEIHGDLD